MTSEVSCDFSYDDRHALIAENNLSSAAREALELQVRLLPGAPVIFHALTAAGDSSEVPLLVARCPFVPAEAPGRAVINSTAARIVVGSR